MARDERKALLRRLGRWYGEQRLAIAWTSTNRAAAPDDMRAKQVTTQAWQHTRPLADGEVGETVFGRGLNSNPVVVLRTSNLFGFECDSEQDLQAIESLGLPPTITVRSSAPYKRHFWFRPPPGLEAVPYTAFRFESGKVNADTERYLLCPPALHPSGAVYSFLPGLGPGEVEIAELPLDTYNACVARWQNGRRVERERLRVDPDAKVEVGNRHDAVFRFACALRRWTSSEEEILAAAIEYDRRHCDPPMGEQRVRSQVRGAMKMAARPPDPEELELRREAEEFLREFLNGKVEPPHEKPSTSKRRRELRRRATSAIAARPVEWLVANVVPLGTLSLVAGVGGLGKSALALAWAAEVTREGSNALVVSYEDAAEQVIRPRFEALDGDLERLFELSIDPLEGSISFPLDLDELNRHAIETEARLIVIDPVSASLDIKLDAHKDRDMRVVLGQLAKLAERLDLAIVMIAHLNKAPGADPYLRINGSTAFYNAARSVLTVTRDGDEDAHRLVAHHKSNYGMLAPVERWRLETVEVPSESGPLVVARLVFLEVADDVSRDDVLLPPAVPEKRSEAEALIMVELAEGRRLSSEVKAAGVETGISAATMKRAATELEVVVEEETTDSGRVTFWALPDWLGGRLTPSHSQAEPTPPAPHEQAKNRVGSGGSAHEAETGDEPTPAVCHKHPGVGSWLARDRVWRCRGCEPPAFPGEILEERP
jgi:AAA domain/Bifunctional DNA primase/polymerase, N-terminal/Primase C terminal 1 (PriCT-1)